MKTSLSILYWIPRILWILFIIFISLFALDVFSEGYSFGETILAFLIHLVPTYILIIALLITWNRLGAVSPHWVTYQQLVIDAKHIS